LQTDYVKSLVEDDIGYINDAAQDFFEDEDLTFSFKDVEEVSFEDGVFSLKFENGEYDYEAKYSIDTMNVYDLGEK
jgi:hypothetical protein